MPMAAGSAKRARGGGVEGSPGSVGDRLSALPDCILHEIMSYLKARQVVQTCVLSKRWTHLWRSVLCLDLDAHDGEFRGTDEGDRVGNFANFVDNLLLFHDAPSLDTFRLRFGGAGRVQSRDADRWIRRAVKYGPSVLELHLGVHSRDVRLPGLGTCSGRLKRLHLSSLTLDASFARQIQSGCPSLDDLELKNCYCTFREITSCTLKTLKMDGCTIDFPVVDGRDRVVVMTVPALVSLHLDIFNFQFGLSVNEATKLVETSIRFQGDWNFQRNVRKLIDGLSSVRNLELRSLKTMKPVDDMSEKFPVFNNLRTLLLSMCDLSDNFQTLGRFLHNAPNLEKLILQQCKLSEVSKKRVKPIRKTLKCQNLLTFQCPKLKVIEIKGSEGHVQQLFDLLFGIWENSKKISVVLSK